MFSENRGEINFSLRLMTELITKDLYYAIIGDLKNIAKEEVQKASISNEEEFFSKDIAIKLNKLNPAVQS